MAWLLCTTGLAGAAGEARASDLHVTDGGDSGAPGQYRTEVVAANKAGGANRVLVDVPKVTLGSSDVDVTASLTVTPTSAAAEVSGQATHFLDNSGSGPLSFTLDSGVTLDSAGLQPQPGGGFGPQPMVLEARTGAWNITIDGVIRTPVPAACPLTACFLSTPGIDPTALSIDQPGSTLTIGPTGVIDATQVNPATDPFLVGNQAVTVTDGTTVNIKGGTVEQVSATVGAAAIQAGVINLTMTGGSVTSSGVGISSG
ncbi:MAG TPA: hypothetical protein VIJ94_11740, partial [Caulobacteraceae bacterium]